MPAKKMIIIVNCRHFNISFVETDLVSNLSHLVFPPDRSFSKSPSRPSIVYFHGFSPLQHLIE